VRSSSLLLIKQNEHARKQKKNTYSPQTSQFLGTGQRPSFRAAIPARYMLCIHLCVTSRIFHTFYSTTHLIHSLSSSPAQLNMPYPFIQQVMFLAKKVTRFAVHFSTLQLADFNLHIKSLPTLDELSNSCLSTSQSRSRYPPGE
jgi:hypothetical protein